ncbi:hypothetical protein IAU59_001102 [Kwoniella sp. CBS 9459]
MTKRKRAPSLKTPRRALSCTECKRRKTKCGAIGKVPCDSCVSRGKPADCRWDGIDSDPPPRGPSVDPESDVSALRRQVDRLERIINGLEYRQTNEPRGNASVAIDNPTADSSNLEDAANHLERIVFGPSVRPGAVETTINTPHAVSGPSPPSSTFPLSSLLGSSSYDTTLLDVLPRLLPNSPLAKDMIEEFFVGPIHCTWHHSLMSLERLESKVDPMWFALYLMILAFAIKFPHSPRPALQAFLASCASDLPSILQRASVTTLGASDYLTRPQIGHIQVSILYIVFLFANLALRHLDSAITTAQWLGLDALDGMSTEKLLQTDPCLAFLTDQARLECCKQLYHLLVFLDGTIFRRPGLWRLQMTELCSLPINSNEDDLAASSTTSERPVTEMTEATLSRIGSAFASAIRKCTHHNDRGRMGRNEILEYDQALQEILKSVPEPSEGKENWAAIVLATDTVAGAPENREYLLLALEICSGQGENLSGSIQAMIDAIDRPRIPMVNSTPLSEVDVQQYSSDVNERLATLATRVESDVGNIIQSNDDLFSFDLSFPFTDDAAAGSTVLLPSWETFDWTMI